MSVACVSDRDESQLRGLGLVLRLEILQLEPGRGRVVDPRLAPRALPGRSPGAVSAVGGRSRLARRCVADGPGRVSRRALLRWTITGDATMIRQWRFCMTAAPRRQLMALAVMAASLLGAGAAAAQPAALRIPATAAVASCSGDYYKNVSGHCVHRPSTSPIGATAKCRDGTYSYSQHPQGTCSYHGGVARWIRYP